MTDGDRITLTLTGPPPNGPTITQGPDGGYESNVLLGACDVTICRRTRVREKAN